MRAVKTDDYSRKPHQVPSVAWQFTWGVINREGGPSGTQGQRPTQMNGTQLRTCQTSCAVPDTKVRRIKEERKRLNRNYSQPWRDNQVSWSHKHLGRWRISHFKGEGESLYITESSTKDVPCWDYHFGYNDVQHPIHNHLLYPGGSLSCTIARPQRRR